MTKFLENLNMALESLSANKMRSFLTMLGVIIGVTAVVILMSVIISAKEEIEGEIISMGSNIFMVFPGNIEETHGPPGMTGVSRLKLRHINLIERKSSSNAKACPIFFAMGNTIKYRRESRASSILMGTNEDFPEVRNWKIKQGTFFRNEDGTAKRKIAIVGQTIVRDLFLGRNPIGSEITIRGTKFRVIGILEEKGRMMNMDADDVVIVPLETLHALLGTTLINEILVKISNADDIDKAVLETKRTLSKVLEVEDFSVRSQGELLTLFKTFASILTIVLGCIAGISLLVGGIGIMNIMLVSVTERTREIGIRKAVGATSQNILFQFLTESVIISVFGGLLGIIFSFLIAQGVSHIAPFQIKVASQSVALAFWFSVGVGVFFGVYPANKASRLDPILALRYE